MHKIFRLPGLGLEVEIGKYARQANGAAWIKQGNNIALATVVACRESKEFAGFFPLTVEYRERPSAAGKFPGGYIKREGKLSENEVLTSRLIDRPIRPLFPSNYFNEIQLLSTIYSSDGKFPPNILALLGASIALVISDIPFLGPIGAVEACKIDGEWKFNVDNDQLLKSKSEIVIAGTKDGICMVEGHCDNIPEKELIDLLFKAHEQIILQVNWQLEIQKELNVKKCEIKDEIGWENWKSKVKNFFPPDFVHAFFTQTKSERGIVLDKLSSDLLRHFEEDIKSGRISESIILYLFDSLVKEVFPDAIVKKGVRVDGRKLNEVRTIEVGVGILPCTHGSAVFRRGETQAISSLTLGTMQDAQQVESLFSEPQGKTFMLHYNFPPFATGEVKPMRGVGRREIGHGYLAESSFLNVLPEKDKFPYTIRSVVDILESNGSSSMATVCATTMALLDSGVPVTDMVSGIAMGLLRDSSSKFHVLTDILGMEDAFGLMDFKITGTTKGIMAIQMDIKDKVGLTKDLLAMALEEAKVARIHILNEMKKVLDAPRKSLSELAPRVCTFKIPTDKIGNIIGPAGRTIKEIIAQTNTQIDIEDDGSVMVYAKDSQGANVAVDWIKILSGEIAIGSIFHGSIKKIADFGVFVELVPGKDGLVHISTIARDIQRHLNQLYKINDKIKVKVVDYERETGRVSLISPDLAEKNK